MAGTPYIAYANYCAYFGTEEKAQFATDILGTAIRLISPVDAAALLGLPWPNPVGPRPDDGFLFIYPYTPDAIIYHPNNSGLTMDPAVSEIFVPGQASMGGMKPNPGKDMIIKWALTGAIVSVPERTSTTTEPIAPIPQRRWTYGFETPNRYEARGAISANNGRDASRAVEGFGHRIRSDTTSATMQLSQSTATGLPTHNSWERFYMRIRRMGSNTQTIWRTGGSIGALGGGVVTINSSGILSLFNRGTFGTDTAIASATIPLEVGRWYKIDLLVKYATAGLDGSLRLYINNAFAAGGVVGTGGDGLGQNQNHSTTTFVEFSGVHTWEVDFDDWHNAEIPSFGGVELLNSIDWLIGTHSVLTKVIPDASNVLTNWFTTGSLGSAPLYPSLNQPQNPTGSGTNVQATVALSTINLRTNALDYNSISSQPFVSLAFGPTCASVFTEAAQSTGAANQCRLGYSSPGFGTVMELKSPTGTPGAFITTLFPNSGSIDAYPIEPFNVIFEKKNTADIATLTALGVIVQYVGFWGDEDLRSDNPITDVFRGFILHNCLYANTAWTWIGSPPDSPVCVSSGQYTGNGTFQTISNGSHPANFSTLPIHLLVIRNKTTNIVTMVNTTMFGPANPNGTNGALNGDIPYIGYDSTNFRSYFTVSGMTRINQNAIDYQFFAFHDPSMRYIMNGEYSHGTSVSTVSNELYDGLFTPEFAMLFQTPATPGGIWMKGPASASLDVTSVGGTVVNNVMSFATGSVTTAGGINTMLNPMAYSLFRTFDGSELVMVQTTSYTGDGTASRVITLSPTSDRFPLAAFVIQRNGGAVGAHYRDCGHAGLNSCNLSSGGNSTTSIIGGGIDSITVGINLNAVGVTYNVLVFPGTTSGWTCGLYCGPNGVAPGDFWETPEELPPGVGAIGEGGLILGSTTALTLLKNLSGIYTLVPGKHTDTFYDRQTGQPSVEMMIPDPNFKTGFIGG